MKACILYLGVLPLFSVVIGCTCEKKVSQNNSSNSEMYASFVGPAGSEGPAGHMGAQGKVGATGAPGAGIAGAAGEQGPSGSAGIRGQTGATGAAGCVVRGSPGVTGPVGPEGPQGVRGDTGEQGASIAGSTGAIGRSGPAGVQGVAGDTGARGATTAGVVGSTGPAGDAGSQGPKGDTGARGPDGVVNRWTSYRAFWFGSETADLSSSDMDQVSEIADYMQKNPSLQAGIDGSVPRGSNQDLADLRVNSVRSVLIEAGVPVSRIETGAFGDANLARERRVEVLLRTSYYSKQ